MTEFALPPTRYAVSGEFNIAYHVFDGGPIDLVMVPGLVSHLEALHELPGYTSFFRRTSRFARVIAFDKRGAGLSDRITGAPTLEERMDDVRAVMDAVGSRRAVLAGFSEGAAMSLTFAASHPERVSHLVLYGAFATGTRHRNPEFHELVARRVAGWGNGEMTKNNISPDADVSPETLHHFGKIERLSVSPGGLKALMLLNGQIDVRPLLGSIRVPCLVLHRRTDRIPIEQGRAIAAALPDARFVELPGGPHAFWVGDTEAILGSIEEFVTGARHDAESDADRVLATVLFTDIAGSTRTAVAVGDRQWRDKLDEHDRLARQIVERHRGKAVKMTGDGVLATFDGPGRAVRCALAFSEAVRSIGLPVRAGLHTGEIELRGEDVGGVTVNAAARVMDECPPGEVLVSRVVTDLVAGAGLQFAERGSRELKGLPGRWELYAASLQRAELSAAPI
jgi:class 3 adenylate cyclase